MTPTGIENLLVLVACYTLGFLWVILPEPGWKFAEAPVRDR
jgi:hypothetical protein